MYMCVCVCVCLCVCVCVCECVCESACSHVYTYINAYGHASAYAYVQLCVHEHAIAYLYAYVTAHGMSMCKCALICTSLYMYRSTWWCMAWFTSLLVVKSINVCTICSPFCTWTYVFMLTIALSLSSFLSHTCSDSSLSLFHPAPPSEHVCVCV